MTGNQQKLALAAAIVVAIFVGATALKTTQTKTELARSTGASGEEGVDLRRARLSTSGLGGGSSADSATVKARNQNKGSAAAGADDDGDLGSILDAATTQVAPIETEAETRERERYEEAQRTKFQYRKLDPEKIRPVELAPVLQDVTKEYGLPENLLAAMMYVETGGTHRDGDHSMEAGYGVMNLRESNLVDTAAEAASLIGKTKEDVFYDQETNIKAAGALLKSYYDDALAGGLSESEALYAAVAQYSGRPDPDLAAALADETAGMLMKGFELHLSDGGGDLVVPPTANPPFLPKNWALTGLTPPTDTQGAQQMPGITPPNAQSYSAESAAGGAQVTP